MRVTQQPVSGMGLRFRELDEDSRKCIERIVAINEQEGRMPRMSRSTSTGDDPRATPSTGPPV